MNVSIIVPDKTVIVSGRAISPVSMDGVGGIRAVQWDGVTGHEELNTGENVPLNSIAKYQFLLDRWQAEADAIDNPPPATREEVLAKKILEVNAKTDAMIETGFVYPDSDGQAVRLTEVDQHNFEGEKNLYAELAWDGIDVSGYFPLNVKVNRSASGDPVFLTIESLAAYKDFIRAGKFYIRGCLAAGWSIKADLQTKTLEELNSWVDPRN